MKNIFCALIFLLITFCSINKTFSQTPPPCNLCSQADVDNYSGILLGSVSISGEDITNLDSLINSVGGIGSFYYIHNNPRLKNVDGLRNVCGNSTGQWLFIKNDSLEVIDLPFSTHLAISDNDKLDSVVIDPLASFGIEILYNPVLGSIIIKEGAFSEVSQITISNNQSLQNLDGLSAVEDVIGNVNIIDNASLESFCGLRNMLLTEPTSPLNISGNLLNPSNEYIITDGPCGNFVVGGNSYATLSGSLAVATDYSFIRVRRDVTISETTVFPSGRNLTLVVEPLRTLTFDAPFTNEGIIINHGTIRMLNGNIFTNIGPSVITGNLLLED